MNKLKYIILCFVVCAHSAFSEDKIVGTYNDRQVTESEIIKHFNEALKPLPMFQSKNFSELDKNVKELVIKGYIGSKLVEKEIKNSDIEKSEEFQSKLESLKKHLLQQELITMQIKKRLNDEMIDNAYKKLAESLEKQEEIKIKQILVKTESEAKKIAKQLEQGTKFNTLYSKYNKSDSSKLNSGKEYFAKGQNIKAIEDIVFSMKVGGVSNPIKTNFGWHIVKLEDKRKAKIPSKDEAKGMLVARLSQQITEDYIQDLYTKSNTKILLQ